MTAPGIEDTVDRRLLINVAYRLLGTMADAEDVVQDTYVRWYRQTDEERDAIESPPAWCVRVATRICLDILNSARRRRERYVGPWIPEPIPGRELIESSSITIDPADRVTLDESVTMAVLVVLESMTPAERVSFVMHDIFQYSFREISEIVGRSEPACRQLASSARRRVHDARPAPEDTQRHAATVIGVKAALERGDINAIVGLLDPQVTAINDGGGRVRAALRPVVGAAKVARFFLGVLHKWPAIEMSVVDVNGEAGLFLRVDGSPMAVIAMEHRDGLITRIWMVLNPDKLGFWNDAVTRTA
ncbi:RNA polymerase sigma factor SigJ [Mycolicibacterium sp. P9-64]|uniref:RNA polymerase sigma factor SigJ n=1 Tax=Mycolicibacterium sp. P9-64 TaxID=2024612 RepID=UPI001F5B4D56|nr:RNA polymerase sigma factor SigJ [Mycolicibacterium sp. P9-64]